jgi:hypothetical protein
VIPFHVKPLGRGINIMATTEEKVAVPTAVPVTALVDKYNENRTAVLAADKSLESLKGNMAEVQKAAEQHALSQPIGDEFVTLVQTNAETLGNAFTFDDLLKILASVIAEAEETCELNANKYISEKAPKGETEKQTILDRRAKHVAECEALRTTLQTLASATPQMAEVLGPIVSGLEDIPSAPKIRTNSASSAASAKKSFQRFHVSKDGGKTWSERPPYYGLSSIVQFEFKGLDAKLNLTEDKDKPPATKDVKPALDKMAGCDTQDTKTEWTVSLPNGRMIKRCIVPVEAETEAE